MKQTPLQEMISKCNRCGFCQDVCPTYAVTGNEFDVARGRIRMMRILEENGDDLTAEKAILTQVDQCLLCGACVENCPSNVPTDTLLRLCREKILKKKGFSLFHSLVYRGVLTQQERLEKISALIRILDKAKIRSHVATIASATAFSFLSRVATYLPETLEIPVRKRLPRGIFSRGTSPRGISPGGQARICYFMGCGTNVFTPGAGLATLNCLEKLGFSVDVPQVSCCGGPHFSSGDIQKARSLARQNIALLSQPYEAIVSDCATCTHTLHDYGAFFPKNDPIQKTLAGLKEKIIDINTFILGNLKKDGKGSMVATKQIVTYHDPCHAVRGMGVRSAPRQIIEAIPGMCLVEMEGADSCCGGAGSYSFRHPEMSQKILNQKMEAIEKTRASILATSCPSCTLQLGSGLRAKNLDIRVVHPMELLAGYLENTKKNKIHGKNQGDKIRWTRWHGKD